MSRRLLIVLFFVGLLGFGAHAFAVTVTTDTALGTLPPLTWDCYHSNFGYDCRPNFEGGGSDWGTCIRTCWQPPVHPTPPPVGLLPNAPPPNSSNLPPLPPSCVKGTTNCDPQNTSGGALVIRLVSPTSNTFLVQSGSYQVEWKARGVADAAPISISIYQDAAGGTFAGKVFDLIPVSNGVVAGRGYYSITVPPNFYGTNWKMWVKVHDPNNLSKVVVSDTSDVPFTIVKREGDNVLPIFIQQPGVSNLTNIVRDFIGSSHPSLSSQGWQTNWRFDFADGTEALFPTVADIQVGNTITTQFTASKGTFVGAPGIFNVGLSLNMQSAGGTWSASKPTGAAWRTYYLGNPAIFSYENDVTSLRNNFPKVRLDLETAGTGQGHIVTSNNTPGLAGWNASSDLTYWCTSNTAPCLFRTYGAVADINAVAVPAPGSKFVRWEGICSGTNKECNFLTVNRQTVRAVFDLCVVGDPCGPLGAPPTLTMNISPTDNLLGFVRVRNVYPDFFQALVCSPDNDPCLISNDAMFNTWGSLAYTFEAVTNVNNPSARFLGWRVDQGEVLDYQTAQPWLSLEQSPTITARVSADATVRAIFTDKYTLTINCNSCFIQTAPVAYELTGETFGSFTLDQISPTGGDPSFVCQNTPCAKDFPGGSQVRITANPAPPNYSIRWTGDCVNASHPTANTCVLTMNANKAAGAGFSYAPPTDYQLSCRGLDESTSSATQYLSRLLWAIKGAVATPISFNSARPAGSPLGQLNQCYSGLPGNPFSTPDDPTQPCCMLFAQDWSSTLTSGSCVTVGGQQICSSTASGQPSGTCMLVRYPASYSRGWFFLGWDDASFIPSPTSNSATASKYIPNSVLTRLSGYPKNQNYKSTAGYGIGEDFYLNGTGGWSKGWSGSCPAPMYSLKVTQVTGAGKVTITDPSVNSLVNQLGPSRVYCGVAPCTPSASWIINTTTTPQTKFYNAGSLTLVAATTSPGVEFLGWTGDCASFGTSTVCTLNMGTGANSGSKQVDAHFGQPSSGGTKYRCDPLPSGGGQCVVDPNGTVISSCPTSCTPITGTKYRCDPLPGGGGQCVVDPNGTTISSCPTSCTPQPVNKYKCLVQANGSGTCALDPNGTTISSCPTSCTPAAFSCTAEAGILVGSQFQPASSADASDQVIYQIQDVSGSTGSVGFSWQGDGQSDTSAQRTVPANFYTSNGTKTTNFTVTDLGRVPQVQTTCSASINITGATSGNHTFTVNNISGEGNVGIYLNGIRLAVCTPAVSPNLPCTPSVASSQSTVSPSLSGVGNELNRVFSVLALRLLGSDTSLSQGETCTITTNDGDQVKAVAEPAAASIFDRWTWHGAPLASPDTITEFTTTMDQNKAVCANFDIAGPKYKCVINGGVPSCEVTTDSTGVSQSQCNADCGNPNGNKFRCDTSIPDRPRCIQGTTGSELSQCQATCGQDGGENFSVSCSVNPQSGYIGDHFTWTATVDPVDLGGYTYAWSGHDEINGQTGSPAFTTYNRTGIFLGGVEVTKNGIRIGDACPLVTIEDTPQGKKKLTITVTGAEKGTVTANTDLIPCDSGSCSQPFFYDVGTPVKIMADINDPNHNLVFWGQACDSASGLTCNLTMDQDYDVSVTFGEPGFDVSVGGGTGGQGWITYDNTLNHTMNSFDTETVSLQVLSSGYDIGLLQVLFGEPGSWGINPNPKPLDQVMCTKDGQTNTCFSLWGAAKGQLDGQDIPNGGLTWDGTNKSFRLHFANRAEQDPNTLSPYRSDAALHRKLRLTIKATIPGQEPGSNITIEKPVIIPFRFLDSRSTP